MEKPKWTFGVFSSVLEVDGTESLFHLISVQNSGLSLPFPDCYIMRPALLLVSIKVISLFTNVTKKRE